jgi:hypothetical protein
MSEDSAELSTTPRLGLSQRTIRSFADLTPEQADQAIRVAAKLLSIRGKRERECVDRKIDLTDLWPAVEKKASSGLPG